ncbi:MAG: GxxExxY protein [Chloroflexi bacterium]|nr:GxxExxY protein [Chloroflexota bacterium]
MTIQTMTTEQSATIQRWCQEWAAPDEADQVPGWQALVQRALGSPQGGVLAHLADDTPVGLAVYWDPPTRHTMTPNQIQLADLYGVSTWLELVLVQPGARRQKVGQTLVDAVRAHSQLVPARLQAHTAVADPAEPANAFLYECGLLQTAGLADDPDRPVNWVHCESLGEEERSDMTEWIGECAYEVISTLREGLPVQVYQNALAHELGAYYDVTSNAKVPILWHDQHIVGWRTLDLLVTCPETGQRVVARCLPTAAPTPADIRELQLDLEHAGAWLGRLLYFGHPDLIDYDVAMWWLYPENLAVVRRAQERHAPTPSRRQPTRARADQPVPQPLRRVN